MTSNTAHVLIDTITTQIVGSVLTLRSGPGWDSTAWKEAINATGFMSADTDLDDQVSGFDYAIEEDGTEVWTFTK